MVSAPPLPRTGAGCSNILSDPTATVQGVTSCSPQLTFDELGTPLRDVTFCVVDLETTGGSHRTDAITEVGAVAVRGGSRISELGTLVDPGVRVPADITRLTGITNAMLHDAPPLGAVLPSVLDMLRGAVLVAHNAPFDTGFLKAACERLERPWPGPPVLCTARLARAVLPHAECPSVKLGTLARHFGCATTPDHRALTDARATVEVLHHLLERIGNLGVQSLEELLQLVRDRAPHRPTTTQRRRRHLANDVPSEPGVYLFRGGDGQVLYVGTSGDLHRRVRSYFTAGEKRRRVRDMLARAEKVDTVVCAHALEASVRELALIAAHRPPYNRRSRNPGRAYWVAPDGGGVPAAVGRRHPRGRVPWARSGRSGPRPTCSTRHSTHCRCAGARSASRPGTPRRRRARCTSWAGAPPRAPVCSPPRTTRPPCTPGATSSRGGTTARCGCWPPRSTTGRPAGATRRPHGPGTGWPRWPPGSTGAAPWPRSRASTSWSVPGPTAGAAGELAVLRHGRLAAAGNAPRGVRPMPVVEALRTGAQTILPGDGPLRGAPSEEVRILHRWLTTGGTRLVYCDPPWAEPARGGGAWREWADRAREASHRTGDRSPDEPAGV
jgi:DNA polymerase-3 subunit epsilon